MMKKDTTEKIEENKSEVCPVDSMNQYIERLEIEPEGKIKKETLIKLRESLESFLRE